MGVKHESYKRSFNLSLPSVGSFDPIKDVIDHSIQCLSSFWRNLQDFITTRVKLVQLCPRQRENIKNDSQSGIIIEDFGAVRTPNDTVLKGLNRARLLSV